MFKHKHSIFPNIIRKHKKQNLTTPYSVKFEGFNQKTEIKYYGSGEDGEEAIRLFLHEKIQGNTLLTNFFENDRVAEISDPDGNDWFCCTKMWVQ